DDVFSLKKLATSTSRSACGSVKVPLASAAGQEIDKLAVRLTQRGSVEAPQGTIALTALFDDDSVTLGTDYALEDDVFSLKKLAITAPATKLEGLAAFDLNTQLAEAELRGDITDLGALDRLHGQQLGGSLKIDTALIAKNGDQDVVVDFGLTKLRGDFGTLENAILQGTVDTLKSGPDLALNLRLREFSAPGAVLRQGNVSVAGPQSQMLVTLGANGAWRELEFALNTNAEVGIVDTGQEISILELDGFFGSQQLQLAKPGKLVRRGQDVTVQDFDLSFGDARLQADVTLDATQAAAKIDLSDLDLTTLEEFGGPALQGSASLSATSEGQPTQPTVAATVDVKGFAPGIDDIGVSSDIDLQVDFADERLNAKLEATGLSEQPLEADAEVPLALSLHPFVFNLEEDAPLSGSARFASDLRRIEAIAGIEGQVLRGPLKIDLTIGGALDAPIVDGEASITNGYIADNTSGAELRNVNLVLKAQNNRIDIAELSAVDGGKGTLSGEGFVDLQAVAAEAFKVALTFNGFRALDSEFGTALLSGTIGSEGAFDDLGVKGDLTIDKADLFLAAPSGTSVSTLDVQEIDAAGEQPLAPAESAPPMLVDLDITVNMPSEIFIRGRGLDTEWGGKLDVTGAATAPVVIGSIEYRRGFIELLGERFQITEGLITFDGADPPIPDIKLSAKAQAGDIDAIVNVTGRATTPKIELTSEPPLPQDEVISRIFFGTDTSSLTPAQGVRLALAVDTLTSNSPDPLNQLRSFLQLDTLGVSGESQEDAAVSAGKYINDRVFVEVERGATDASGKARMEVDLGRGFSADTEVTEDAQTGVGLNWSFDY
ncbi:MAG: translocation/assembly module TamB domain-containing protein, partial [Pseudomonadota bacterium]